MLVVFAAIQLASYAFDAPAAAVAGTLPARIPMAFGLSVYRWLDRIAPAPYVESTLAAYWLERGDPAQAQRYAIRLPASATRDELLARAAQAQGDSALAYEYFLAAPDVDAVQDAIDARAMRDPAAAYALERVLAVRLAMLTTHPDAVAQSYWQMGRLANLEGARLGTHGGAAARWFHQGMDDLQAAADLAPLSDKYGIAAANQAMLLGDVARSQRLFEKVVEADPGSADGLAGLGVVAYRRGDLSAARTYLTRARRLDPNAGMVRALANDLR